ncbi:MAG: hypothetical protein R6T98_01335, partial [Desulfatiglandales bacterium]
ESNTPIELLELFCIEINYLAAGQQVSIEISIMDPGDEKNTPPPPPDTIKSKTTQLQSSGIHSSVAIYWTRALS